MAGIGSKRVMVIGLLLSALACFGFMLVESQTGYLLLACIIAVLGFGLASVLPAMTEAAISHAPRAQSGIASGMLNVSRQVGGVIGVAILGSSRSISASVLRAGTTAARLTATYPIAAEASSLFHDRGLRSAFPGRAPPARPLGPPRPRGDWNVGNH